MLGTGCGRYLLRWTTVSPDRMSRVRVSPKAYYTGATGTPVQISWLLNEEVGVRVLITEKMFVIVPNLTVPMIICKASRIGISKRDKANEN